MNVLIGIPSPRDIPEFLTAMDQIEESKVWAKYIDEYTAYNIIRSAFLDFKEFTHLCIIPDDLIVTPIQFYKLKGEVEKEGYPVLSGTCVIDSKTTELTTRIGDKRVKDGEGIIKVDYEGFSCCFIRREVVERIKFNTTYSFDVALERECKRLNIPIHVDLSVKLKHLRLPGKLQNSGIGLKESKVNFRLIRTIEEQVVGSMILWG